MFHMILHETPWRFILESKRMEQPGGFMPGCFGFYNPQSDSRLSAPLNLLGQISDLAHDMHELEAKVICIGGFYKGALGGTAMFVTPMTKRGSGRNGGAG